jgi:hypothetical protein
MHVKFSISRFVRTVNKPLNSSIRFVNDTDIFLSNGTLQIAIVINSNTYQDIISRLIEDLILGEQYKQEFTPSSDLRHIETLLQQLEFNIRNFHVILPRLDRRRGLFNIGGSLLKISFGRE